MNLQTYISELEEKIKRKPNEEPAYPERAEP
jgi:hypothetical protein